MWNRLKEVRGSSKILQNRAPIGARQDCRNTISVNLLETKFHEIPDQESYRSVFTIYQKQFQDLQSQND